MFVSGGLNAGLALLGFGLKLLVVRSLTYKELAEATLQFALWESHDCVPDNLSATASSRRGLL